MDNDRKRLGRLRAVRNLEGEATLDRRCQERAAPGQKSSNCRAFYWTDVVARAIAERRLLLVSQDVRAIGPDVSVLYSECLVRLIGQQGSVIYPGKFVPHLEVEGSITMLDKAVLHRTLDLLEARSDIELGCNLSARNFDTPDQWDRLLRLVSARPQLAGRLVLEVTETCPVRDIKLTQRYLDQARALGVRVAIDDFGTSFATTEILARLNPDIVKIDAAYVNQPAALRELVSMAAASVSCVVVEGGDTHQQFAIAVEAGATHVQGRSMARETMC